MLIEIGAWQTYEAYGVRFRSRLPDLPAHRVPIGGAEVVIELGDVPDHLVSAENTPHFEAKIGLLLCRVAEVGSFLVADGTRISVAPAAGASPAAVHNMLFGMAFGALLIQRGQFALHGASVLTPAGVAVFCGDGGAGKSTLAALLGPAGFPVVSDDVSAVVDVAGHLGVARGTTVTKLTDAARESLRWSADGPRIQGFREPKTVASLGSLQVTSPAHRLGAIYVLDRTSAVSQMPLDRLEAVAAIERHVYKRAAVRPLGRRADYFTQALRIASDVPVFVLGHPAAAGPVAWAEEVAALLRVSRS